MQTKPLTSKQSHLAQGRWVLSFSAAVCILAVVTQWGDHDHLRWLRVFNAVTLPALCARAWLLKRHQNRQAAQELLDLLRKSCASPPRPALKGRGITQEVY